MGTEKALPGPAAGRSEAAPAHARDGREAADAVTGGMPVQRLAAAGLRVFAAAGVLGGLAASVLFWLLVLRYPLDGDWLRGSLVAGVVLQLLFLVTVAAWAVLIWRRAGQIGTLGPPDYPAITCVAACTRLLGELLALVTLAASLGFAVATLAGQPLLADTAAAWLGGDEALPAWAVPAATALTALLWPLAGLAFAGAVLFAAYLVAELMILMLEFVRDVRRIREAAEAGLKREAGSSGDGRI